MYNSAGLRYSHYIVLVRQHYPTGIRAHTYPDGSGSHDGSERRPTLNRADWMDDGEVPVNRHSGQGQTCREQSYLEEE